MPDETGSWLVMDATTIDIGGAGRRTGVRVVPVVRVFGEIDLATRAAFESELDHALGRDPVRIVLDCTAMGFCDARGLGALMRTVARGARRGTDVAVVGLGPRLVHLCAELWPGPQPTPYPDVTSAVADAGVGHATMPAEASA